MRKIVNLVERAAPSTVPVFISGESGTGKEVTAQKIHSLSERRHGPYVPINCAAIPDNLIESELFGHEKGAFTGADHRHEGCFERARGGTLLLDEITEMRTDTQAKLLRVIQERKLTRVGGTREVPTDVRILAASNRDLDAAVRERRLRQDLYYRLNVLPIHLPPLRERLEDVPLLVSDFIQRANRDNHKQVEGIEEDCLEALSRYHWPGNIRELLNVIERAVIVTQSSLLSTRDFPPQIARSVGQDLNFTVRVGCSLRDVQREFVSRTIAYADGNKVRAAEILGVPRRTLYSLLERFEDRPRARQARDNEPTLF
jgi:two-component system response regulator HydG